MSRTLKIALVPFYQDKTQITDPALLNDLPLGVDAAVQRMIVANPDNNANDAVLQFWTEATDGYLQFQVTTVPWSPLKFTKDDISCDTKNDTNPSNDTFFISRQTVLAKAKAAMRGKPGIPDPSHFDGFIVLMYPGIRANVQHPRKPAGVMEDFALPGNSTRGEVSCLPIANNSPFGPCTHSFMTHEVGHMLGLPDSDGIWFYDSSVGNWNGGYNDPLEIMSAQTYAHVNPTYKGPAIPDWPLSNARDCMGPAPSLAIMHYHDPAWLPFSTVREMHVVDDTTPSFRLNAAYGANKSSRLAIVHYGHPGEPVDPLGSRRMYLEFRPKNGRWDQGLDKAVDPGIARSSLVAHVVQEIPYHSSSDNGMRACFKGQIFVPIEVDSDLEVPGTPYTVRITQVDPDHKFVTVKVTRSSPRSLVVEASNEIEDVPMNQPIDRSAVFREIQIDRRARDRYKTPCGDHLRWGTWETTNEVTLTPTSWGFGGDGGLNFGSRPLLPNGTPPPPPPPALQFTWTVGGMTVSPTAGTILANCKSTDGRTFGVYAELDERTKILRLKSQLGEKYEMVVRADLVDTVRGFTGSVKYTFKATGSYLGYPPADVAKLARCGAKIASQLRIPTDLFRPPRPPGPGDIRPNWGERIKLAVERRRQAAPAARNLILQLNKVAELAQTFRERIR